MRRVVIESPFGFPNREKATIERNQRLLKRAIADCFSRGEAPFASHGLYPGALDDANPEERRLGMLAGFEWGDLAEATVVYIDHGMSPGMIEGVERAKARGRVIEERSIGAEPEIEK